MGKCRDAREAALQIACSLDLGGERPVPEAFWDMRPTAKNIRDLAEETITGIAEHKDSIDEILDAAAPNYELERLSTVDRNILRIAIYEMHHRDDVPPVVSVNEAIEIAKRFGTEKSASFVNGVLDHIIKGLDRPLREAAEKSSD